MRGARYFKISFYQIVVLLMLICMSGSVVGAEGFHKGLGDATTSPWLADSRIGVRTHIESFRNGASFLIPESSYARFFKGEKLIGDPTGQFIAPKATIDKLLKQANGDLNFVKEKLGLPKQAWNEKILRVDIHNPLLHNVRFPSGFERGANSNFKWGGYTSKGLPEAVTDQVPQNIIINQVPIDEFSISDTNLFQQQINVFKNTI